MRRLFAFSMLCIMLIACQPPQRIQIIITPTPQPSATPLEATPITVAMLPSPTATLALEVPTLQIATSPAVTETIPTVQIGSIIDPNYTPAPTNTPLPSETPLPTATETPPRPLVITPMAEFPRLDGNRVGIQAYWHMNSDLWWYYTTRAQELNVGWIKMQADWGFIQNEGVNTKGEVFEMFIGHVRRARDAGFNVMLSIAKAPLWARNTSQQESGPPDDPQQLANFITQLLTEIGPGRVQAIEIWNEPNLIREWGGALPFNGAGYMQLFRPAYAAIKAYDPTIQVITAGLAPTGNSAGSVDDRQYLQQMYSAGLAQYSDVVVGIHPYGWGNPPDFTCCDRVPDRGWDDDPHFFFLDSIQQYRDILVNNGHANAQLWTTELGWATWDKYPTQAPDIWMSYNGEFEQTQYTLRAIEIAQTLNYMGPVILWNLNYANPTVIEQSRELAAYSLLYDVGNGVTNQRPLFDGLKQSLVR